MLRSTPGDLWGVEQHWSKRKPTVEPKIPKRASIIKTFVSFIQCFYCFKIVNIIIRIKQKGMRIYIMNVSK